jgi:ABC-type proline/glycine betaine transport system ATPase subunit
LTLRKELKDYHTEIGRTAIYVTHNLPEAFALADRVAMMREGKIIQIDTPLRILKHPANQLARDFMRCSEM